MPESVARADVVTCATSPPRPSCKANGSHRVSRLDLIGGFTSAMREADDACSHERDDFRRHARGVPEVGDLLGPLQRGVLANPEQWPTLGALCRAQAPGRSNDVERTQFKAVGTALEDLAAAALVYDRNLRE
nr:hypothetical protein [Caballeronia sp. AZ7_KS35]